MKVGDLVKMKYCMFWQLKGKKEKYTEQFFLVLERTHNTIRLLHPDGQAKIRLAENYEVINESR